MCESCQRPASNGIIVPRDSGPLTTSALEKSQKQTASANKISRGSLPGAELTGPRPQQRRLPQLRGPDQTPRRPQHDPPRRSGTVGASLFPSSMAWAPGSELLSCQPSSLAKGLRIFRKAVPRWTAFPCTQLEQFPSAQRAESLTHSLCLLPESEFVNLCLVSAKRAGRTCREGPWTSPQTRGQWELAWAHRSHSVNPVLRGPPGALGLLPVGHGLFARRMAEGGREV